jgi:hypothetical protein
MYGSYEKALILNQANNDASLATAIALEAGAAVKSTWSIIEPMTVTRFGIQVTVAFNYDTQTVLGILKLKKYVVYGSSAGEVELASIELTHGLAAGSVVYVDVDNALGVANLKAGEQLVAEVTTAGVGGTETGDYTIFVAGNPRPEVAANQAYMVNQT